MKKIIFSIALLSIIVQFDGFGAPTLLVATDYGLKADGVSDDGPAIRAMLDKAAQIEGPVELRFPENRVIAVETGTDRYVFNLDRRKDLAINGQGSEFRLDPDLRFMDAFHAKGNRAEMLFDGCILTGLGDDAFNLVTHCSRVRKIHSPNEFEIHQHFPIQYIPMRAGDTLVVMDPESNEIVGESRIESIREIPAGKASASLQNRFAGSAPTLRVKMERSLPKVKKGMVAWDRETSNPKSIVRDCTIRRSCRFQTNTKVVGCDVEAFMWFYGDELEGPGPEYVSIQESVMKSASTGRKLGNAVGVTGWQKAKVPDSYQPDRQTAMLKKVRVVDNEIWGALTVRKAFDLEIRDNRFPAPEGRNVNIGASGGHRAD